jgi:hypothetical protein
MSTQPHLWEIDHPYYAAQGNYYARPSEGLHVTYDSWADFMDEQGNSDHDMNLVYRWDWQRPDLDDYEPGEELGPDVLQVFWVGQRKAILRSTECVVTEADEPAVRAWLTDRARTITAIWDPVSLAPAPASA